MRGLLISHFYGQNKGAGWSSECTSQNRFDETYQFAAGSANVFVTRFAERSENSGGRLTSDIDTTTDRSEDRKSNNESLIKRI